LTWRYGGPIRRTRQFLGFLTRRPRPAETRPFGLFADRPRIRNEAVASRGWTRWAALVVRRRWTATIIAAVALGLLIIPVFGISIGLAGSSSLAKSGPAYEALQTLERSGVSTGALTPIEVLVDQSAANDVSTRLRGVPGVVDAYAPTGPASQRAGTAVVIGIPQTETANATSIKPVSRVKTALKGVPGVIGVSGVGALQIDYLKAVYGNFPLMLGLIILVTYVLLVRAFRSLLLPLKAVILNLISVSAVFGAMVLFWQDGHGSSAVFGIAATGAITFWLPIMVFAFLFGLSMDYEVFILARVREEYDAHGDTNEAVVVGLGRTGRLVTSAALILFLAFLSLASGPQTDIKLFATALGFGILLDATIVRALLVPALVSLFGSWNWYLPDGVAKLLRVKPSHAASTTGALPHQRDLSLPQSGEEVSEPVH
ncbi:MAG TPA: MMPL family transporter, partial [Trebonia sp.]